jgi:hypothetical protein
MFSIIYENGIPSVKVSIMVVKQNLAQMGCIGRSTKSCSNGLHWLFNNILFKWVALVVQQNLVQMGCIGRSTKSCSNPMQPI